VINIRPRDLTTVEKPQYPFSRRRGAPQSSWAGLKKRERMMYLISIYMFFFGKGFFFEVAMHSLMHVPGDKVLHSKNCATLKPQLLNTESTKRSVTPHPLILK
jgi:hypothetical protein